MPVNKSALIRFRVITKYLIEHSRVTKEQLRIACERVPDYDVSFRTIDSDIHAMRKDERLGYFAPIVANKWTHEYSYSEPGYSIEEVPMNNQEYEALLLASSLLEQFSDAPVCQTFSEKVKMVAKQSGLRRSYGYVSLYHHIEFEDHRDRISARFLPNVIKAFSDRKVLSIVYQPIEEKRPEKMQPQRSKPARITFKEPLTDMPIWGDVMKFL